MHARNAASHSPFRGAAAHDTQERPSPATNAGLRPPPAAAIHCVDLEGRLARQHGAATQPRFIVVEAPVVVWCGPCRPDASAAGPALTWDSTEMRPACGPRPLTAPTRTGAASGPRETSGQVSALQWWRARQAVAASRLTPASTAPTEDAPGLALAPVAPPLSDPIRLWWRDVCTGLALRLQQAVPPTSHAQLTRTDWRPRHYPWRRRCLRAVSVILRDESFAGAFMLWIASYVVDIPMCVIWLYAMVIAAAAVHAALC